MGNLSMRVITFIIVLPVIAVKLGRIPSATAQYLHDKSGLLKEVVSKIAQKAQGKFLLAQAWTDAFLDRAARSDQQLLDDLDYIPDVILTEYCEKRVEGIKRNRSGRELQVAYMTFCLLIAACDNITILALQQALALRGDLGYIPVDAGLLDHRNFMMRAMKGLVTVDNFHRDRSFVHFLHGSFDFSASHQW